MSNWKWKSAKFLNKSPGARAHLSGASFFEWTAMMGIYRSLSPGPLLRLLFILLLRGGGFLRFLYSTTSETGLLVHAADFVAENADRMTLCESAECAVAALTDTSDDRARDRIYILFVTYSSALDSYPTLYTGWIFEMFEHLDVHIVVYDVDRYLQRGFSADVVAANQYYWVDDFNRCMARMADPGQPVLSQEWCEPLWDLYHIAFGLPTKNLIHMTIQEAPLCTNICMLSRLRMLFGNTTPQVILHFNHERPWLRQSIACDIAGLRASYSSASLVLRNYYYSGLEDAALYFPLGTGRLSFERAIPSNGFTNGFPHRSASVRDHKCAFLGRMRYEGFVGQHEPGVRGKQSLPPQEAERAVMAGALQRLGCLHLGFDNLTQAVPIGTYASLLNNAVFAPCPAGNNPETFRHYEALELGAIPIIIKINDSDVDFLQKWYNYPGPVFRNWREAEQYMAIEHAPGYLDALQARLAAWYGGFKGEYKRAIARSVLHALSRPEGGTDYAAENGRIREALTNQA